MYPEPKSMDPIDTFSFDGTPHMVCHESKVPHYALHVSILCELDICVVLHQSRTANLATIAVAFAVDVAAACVDTRLGVPIVVAPMLTRVVVCGFVASGMQCLLNIPKMLMVN